MFTNTYSQLKLIQPIQAYSTRECCYFCNNSLFRYARRSYTPTDRVPVSCCSLAVKPWAQVSTDSDGRYT